ncbi:mannose-1-phosphate guanylyltransferase [Roseivivax marinus]|uniref:mannose-1-phosphate guanylyltransferase n=1 Tax=Roseivivax marinus TaxID=1379903 RepID=UPI00273F8D56|nr:sugar phosphate nucleotidyltransferase [Roseivivax marinus]
MTKIAPVVLSGGMGTRLWPMSRIRQPKQFQSVDGNGGPSFLQSTVLRHRGDAFTDPVLVASAREEDLLEEQLSAVGVKGTFIGEPMGRNTGPAVLAAALRLAEVVPATLMLVLPSDHAITGDLNLTVGEMARGASEGRIVLFGIVPRHAETGFGYISAGAAIEGHDGLHHVESFIEKPSLELAESLIAEGRTFWASGISMMRADVLIDEFAVHQPETLEAVKTAIARATPSRTGIVLDGESFEHAENEPTERLIFERSDLVSVAPTDVDWNDVGAWTAVHSLGKKSAQGNVETGEVMCIETSNSLIRASDKLVTVIGLEDVIIVDTADALLVTNHKNAQKVKEAVSVLKADGRIEVISHVEKAIGGIARTLSPEPVETPEPVQPAQAPASSDTVCEHVLQNSEKVVVEATGPGATMLTVADGCGHFEGTTCDCEMLRESGAHMTIAAGERVSVSNSGPAPLRFVTVRLAPLGEAAGRGKRNNRDRAVA